METQSKLQIKEHIVSMLRSFKSEIDVSNYDPYNYGVGCNELRYWSLDASGEPQFESNNVHNWNCGEDVYAVYHWNDLSDYEAIEIERILADMMHRHYHISQLYRHETYARSSGEQNIS